MNGHAIHWCILVVHARTHTHTREYCSRTTGSLPGNQQYHIPGSSSASRKTRNGSYLPTQVKRPSFHPQHRRNSKRTARPFAERSKKKNEERIKRKQKERKIKGARGTNGAEGARRRRTSERELPHAFCRCSLFSGSFTPLEFGSPALLSQQRGNRSMRKFFGNRRQAIPLVRA